MLTITTLEHYEIHSKMLEDMTRCSEYNIVLVWVFFPLSQPQLRGRGKEEMSTSGSSRLGDT